VKERDAGTRASTVAHPPETLEGWYACHEIFRLDRARMKEVRGWGSAAAQTVLDTAVEGGWTRAVRLIGSTADVMFVHFRPALDDLMAAQRAVRRLPIAAAMEPVAAFLSVTEAGLYHVSADLARQASERGGHPGDASYVAEARTRGETERENPHVQRRLYPPVPDNMPYVCFYPMSKRRAVGQNWYELDLAERSRLMQTHGTTGRQFAGRVQQIITGSTGLSEWEWGVTLFASDPLDFKRIVTAMRFDEVSAQYAEFGEFWVGRVASGDDLAQW